MTNQSESSKVLIVGGSGFLSGTLARRAVGRGHRVWTITRGQRPIPEGVNSLVTDRHDKAKFVEIVTAANTTWDLVVDCIAFEPGDIQQDIAVFGKLTNHLVFISTDFVYDSRYRQFPQTEETEHYLSDGYGHQKRLCELELINYQGDMCWTVVRPTHIYGPGSQLGCLPEHSRDPKLIKCLETGQTLILIGGGHFLQQPVLARDLADLLLDLGGNDKTFGQFLNAAGPDVLESRAYYQIIADILGVDLHIEEAPVAQYLVENPVAINFLCHRFYDLSKLAACRVPLPSTPMEQGLKEQIEHLLSE